MQETCFTLRLHFSALSNGGHNVCQQSYEEINNEKDWPAVLHTINSPKLIDSLTCSRIQHSGGACVGQTNAKWHGHSSPVHNVQLHLCTPEPTSAPAASQHPRTGSWVMRTRKWVWEYGGTSL